jgi:hypothetical protein
MLQRAEEQLKRLDRLLQCSSPYTAILLSQLLLNYITSCARAKHCMPIVVTSQWAAHAHWSCRELLEVSLQQFVVETHSWLASARLEPANGVEPFV